MVAPSRRRGTRPAPLKRGWLGRSSWTDEVGSTPVRLEPSSDAQVPIARVLFAGAIEETPPERAPTHCRPSSSSGAGASRCARRTRTRRSARNVYLATAMITGAIAAQPEVHHQNTRELPETVDGAIQRPTRLRTRARDARFCGRPRMPQSCRHWCARPSCHASASYTIRTCVHYQNTRELPGAVHPTRTRTHARDARFCNQPRMPQTCHQVYTRPSPSVAPYTI